MADIRIVPASGSINITGSANFTGLGRSVLFVSESGRIGMGTTAMPDAHLHIYSASVLTPLKILVENGATLGQAGIDFKTPTQQTRLITTNGIPFYIYDQTAVTERLRITTAGNIGINTSSPTARLEVVGSTATSASSALIVRNSTPSTLLNIQGDGQTTFTTPASTVLAPSQSAFTISPTISQSAVVGAQVYGVSITPTFFAVTGSQTETALRVAATFTGSAASAGSTNIIADFGATSVGSQLTITDVTSGSIYMVNDVSGLPIIEATSDWDVNMYSFPKVVFQKKGDRVNISGSFAVTGSSTFNGSVTATSFTGSFSGSAVAPGSDTQIVYNSGGTLTANNGLVYSGSRVGIGTTAPTDTLHLVGNIRFTGNIRNDNSIAFLTSTSGAQTIATRGILLGTSYDSNAASGEIRSSANSNITLNSRGTGTVIFQTADATKMVITNAGNVGIGTSTPLGNLHISSGTSGDAILILEADTDNNDENDTPQIWFKADGGINEGLIGLNNNTLDLVSNIGTIGGIRFLTGTTINTGSSSPYTGSSERMRIADDGNVGIGTSSPTQKLTVAGDALITGSLTVNGTVTAKEFKTEFVSASITYISGSHKFGDSADDVHEFTGSVNITGSVRLGKGTILYGDTTNPSLTLDQTTGTYLRYGTTSDLSLQGSVSLLRAANNVQLITGTTTHLLVSSSGNVGIGLTDPAAKLEVLSSQQVRSAANAQHKLRIEARDDYYNDTDSAGIWISSGGGAGPFSGQGAHLIIEGRKNSTRDIYFKVGDTTSPQHIMAGNGNVGIGTTSPSNKLQVVGGITATSFTGSFSGSVSAPGATTQVAFNSGGTLSADGGFVYSGSRVGIGTATPTQRLHINGPSARLLVTDNNQGATGFIAGRASTEVFLGNDGALPLSLLVNSTERMRIDTTGRVGIGTISPSAILHVSGTNTQTLLQVSSPSAASALFVSGSGNIGIGTSTPVSRLHVHQTSATSYREQLAKFTVSDAGNDAFFINNGTSTDNTFWPAFVGYGSSATRSGIQFLGLLPASADASDSADRGILNFEVLRTDNAADPSNGNFSAIVNRKLFTWSGASGTLMTMMPTGNLGIGTSSPTQKLTVAGDALITGSLTVQGTITAKEFKTEFVSASITYISGSHKFGDSADDVHEFTGSVNINGPLNATSLTGSFTGSVSAPGSDTQIAYNNTGVLAADSGLVYSGSRVGIGISTPQQRLHIAGSSTTLAIQGSNTAGGTQGIQFLHTNTAAAGYIGSITTSGGGSGTLVFSTTNSGSESMRLTNTGLVGIGTTSPASWSRLSVNGNLYIRTTSPGSFNDGLVLDRTGSTWNAIIWSTNGNNASSGDYFLGHRSGTTNWILMGNQISNTGTTITAPRVDAAWELKGGETGDKFEIYVPTAFGQAVGIGTASPAARLHVSGAANTLLFELDSPTSPNALVVSGSGRVGIGVATPTATLQVSGSADVVNIAGSGSTANTSLFSIDGNNGRLFEVSDDLSDSLFSVNTIAGLPVMEAFADNRVVMGAFNQNDLVISGSRVGIGTATPTAKLHVSGTANAALFEIDSPALSNIIYVSGSGNVGFGTATPTSRLTVFGGTTTLRGAGGVSNTIVEIIQNTGSIAGAHFVGTGNDTQLELRRTSDGLTQTRLTPTGNSFINALSGNLGIGTTISSASLHISGASSANLLRIDSPALSNIIYVSGSGNVGFGTSSPLAKLDIFDSFSTLKTVQQLSATSIVDNTGPAILLKTSPVNLPDRYGVKLGARRGTGEGSAHFVVELEKLGTTGMEEVFRIQNTGNIGIGTTAPGTKLHTVGAGYFSGETVASASLGLDQNYSNVGLILDEDDYIYTKDSTALRRLIGKTSDVIQIGQVSTILIDGIQLLPGAAGGYVSIYDDATEYARFQSGRLGIGTANPSASIHVVGNVLATSFTGSFTGSLTGIATSASYADTVGAGNIAIQDESVELGSFTTLNFTGTGVTATDAGSGLIQIDIPGGASLSGGSTDYVARWADSTTLTTGSIFDSGSKVGIGTTAPGYTLDVNGNVYANTGYYLAVSSITQASNGNLTITNPGFGFSGRDIDINPSRNLAVTATDVILDVTGEVGIGTTSPLYKLDVTGDIRATGNIYASSSIGINTTSPTTALHVVGTISGSLIHSSGDVIAYQSSDMRLKDNITPISNPIQKINKIGGYEFDWNNKQDIYTGHDVGVIAQQIEEVLPSLVTETSTGYKGVKYDKLVALLIEGVKEQQRQIDELRQEIQNLKK